MKQLWFATAVTVGLAALAAAQGPAPPSLACTDKGSYTGNVISPKFALTIHDDRAKTWEYTYEDDFSGTMPLQKLRVAGTYEVRGGVAVFTGQVTGKAEAFPEAGEQRFGVNFGTVNGKVAFNRLFPDRDGTLRYRRQWFEKQDGQWRLAEERTLTLTAAAPTGKQWQVKLRGERVLPALGEKGVERFEGEYTYRKSAGHAWEADVAGLPVKWCPRTLVTGVTGGRLEWVMLGDHGIGELRGFHPRLARRDP